ncbi:MAG: PAS domain S-box protein [Bacteroidia bacterium]|nr:PAS domain S-box protein [Bacteroidia bacterium]
MIDSIQPEQLNQAQLTALVEELQRSKADIEARRFIDAGVAKFANLLRWQENDSLEIWASRIIEELVGTVNGLQACLYMRVGNHSATSDSRELHLIASYAYPLNERIMVIKFGDGIIGQAAKSARSHHFHGIGQVFESRSQTGLTMVHPQAIIIQPLIYNGEVEGMLEISSLNGFSPQEVELIRTLSESIAANMMSIRSQETMKRLYEEAHQKTMELQAREEEMRQNMEELEATQEEMRRQQIALLESEGKFRLLSELTQEGICILVSNQIQELNRAFGRIFDYSYEELLNQEITKILTPETMKRIEYMRSIQSVDAYEGIGIKKDGSLFYCEIQGLSIHYKGQTADGLLLRDISQRKKQEYEIQEKNFELQRNLMELEVAQEEMIRQQTFLKNTLQEIEAIKKQQAEEIERLTKLIQQKDMLIASLQN